MQTIFWHCVDIIEREPMDVCLNCGAVDTIIFPNDGCMECGAGLEYCVRFLSKKMYEREMEEAKNIETDLSFTSMEEK